MTYELYKLIHLTAIFLFLSGTAVIMVGENNAVIWKIVTGIASLVILIAGMGLMARLGHGMQPWMWGKIAIWFIVTVAGHSIAKRFPAQRKLGFWGVQVLAFCAALLAIYKPF